MLLKMRVEMDYWKMKGIERLEKVIKDETGANDANSTNTIFAVASGVIVFGVVMTVVKKWFPDVLEKLFEKVEEVIGV